MKNSGDRLVIHGKEKEISEFSNNDGEYGKEDGFLMEDESHYDF